MNALISFLTTIRWQDIVDVVLNSYILFRLYVLFRGTNVIRVVAGLALLWIFQRLAAGMGLIVTSWAMQGIIAGAALIIIIVFRNEIRNVLQAKNIRAILWGFPDKSARAPIDSIVEGVYDLARKRTGALIVIPGKEDIDEVVQGGVRWQGLVSREMLMSIFWSGNPVHDGAAVMSGDRIARVGTILPLSHRDDLPGKYGTRHRAAVGLTEQSDAMVIVVSEERGEVIVVKNSDIIPIQDNLALKRQLRTHLGIESELDEAHTRRESMELGMAAAVCFLCMAGVWFSFARGLETLTSLEVPLEYVNRDSRMQILSASDNTVRLHLSGSGALISSLKPDQVKVKLDLDNAVNGENVFTISHDNIAMPPGVRLNRIEPSQVKVVLDFPITKEIPIQVDWVGTLPEGLILKTVRLNPEVVPITGVGKILNNIRTLYTEKVQMENLRSSGQMTVGLALSPASLKIAGGFKDRVEITYIIGKRQG
ncbi:MAG: diadenylate cyclase [Desulfobacteraceae bacterium]